MVTADEVRAFAEHLPASYDVVVRGRLKFRIKQIVWLVLDDHGEHTMGFAFPKEHRDGLIASDPDRFLLPRASDRRYNWCVVRLDRIDVDEMREIVLDAWAFCAPKRVLETYLAEHPELTAGEP